MLAGKRASSAMDGDLKTSNVFKVLVIPVKLMALKIIYTLNTPKRPITSSSLLINRAIDKNQAIKASA